MKELLNTMTGNPYPAVRKAIRGDKSGLIAVAAMGVENKSFILHARCGIYGLDQVGEAGTIKFEPTSVEWDGQSMLGFKIKSTDLADSLSLLIPGDDNELRPVAPGDILFTRYITFAQWEESGIEIFNNPYDVEYPLPDSYARVYFGDDEKQLTCTLVSANPAPDPYTRQNLDNQGETSQDVECVKDGEDQNTGYANVTHHYDNIDVNPFSNTYEQHVETTWVEEGVYDVESCPLPEPPQPDPDPVNPDNPDNPDNPENPENPEEPEVPQEEPVGE